MPDNMHERTNDMHDGKAKSGGAAKWVIGFIFIALIVGIGFFGR